MSVINTIQFIMNGADVRRWHTSPTMLQETVGHHSMVVASLMVVLYPDTKTGALVAALHHDLGEQVTGDIPAPTKRELGIRDVINAHDEKACLDAGLYIPPLTTEENRRLKFADSASGALQCVKEMHSGNLRMRPTLKTYITYLAVLQDLNNPYEELLMDYLGQVRDGDE